VQPGHAAYVEDEDDDEYENENTLIYWDGKPALIELLIG